MDTFGGFVINRSQTIHTAKAKHLTVTAKCFKSTIHHRIVQNIPEIWQS